MELNINITTSDKCKIVVQDVSTYLAEDFSGIVKGKFKYSDTISIDVLQHNQTLKAIYKEPIYTKHDTLKSIDIPIGFDGWFSLVHLVIPNIEWFNKELEKTEGSALGLYDIVYFSDGIDIYKYINGETSQVTIDDILEINTVNTTISRISRDFVSICFLRKCYINLCQQIFNDRGISKCWNKNKVNSELIYKRDLVWMAINVVKYLTQCEQLAEAERVIETIQGCNGLCVSTNLTNNTNGCGCSK